MRKSTRKIATVLVMSMMMAAVPQHMPADIGTVKVEAVTKKSTKVKYTLKNGVLTIKGKGKMPKSMTFKNNKKIKKVVIKKGVTSISEKAFLNCTKLKEVKIASTVTEIGRKAFCNTGLKEITIPKKVKNIGEKALAACKNLTKIKMPGDVTVSGATEEPNYLDTNSNVDTIEFTTDLKLETISYLFANNFKIYSQDKLYKDIDGVVYTKDGKEIVRVPSGRTELTVADECEVFCTNAIFYSVHGLGGEPEGFCTELEKVVLPKNVKKIEYEKHYAIWTGAPYDVEIKEWVIENKQISGLDNLVYAIYDHYWSEMFFPDVYFETPGVSDLITIQNDMMVCGDTLLYYGGKEKDVVIPDGIKRIGRDAFTSYPAYTMQSLVLPEDLEEIGEFSFVSQFIKSVEIPATVKKIADGAFRNCPMLSNVVINSGVTNIGDYAFEECTSLNNITIPNSVRTIGSYAFSKSGLNEVKLSENLNSIGAYAFYGTNITEVVIPKNVKTVEQYAFSNCPNLKSVVIKNKKADIHNMAFKGSSNLVVKGKLKAKKNVVSIDLASETKKKKKITYKFSWNKVEGVKGYQVMMADNKKFTKNKVTKNVKKNQYKKTIKSDQKKYIKVRTYKVVKGKKVYGKWSESMKMS